LHRILDLEHAMNPPAKPQPVREAFDDAPTAKREIIGAEREALLEDKLEEEADEVLSSVKRAV
jgi:hypothetical protein